MAGLRALVFVAGVCLGAAPAAAQVEDAAPLTAEEVKRRWHERLDGRHFTARVRLEMDLAGLREDRHLVVYRDDTDGSDERVLIRFESPPDLRNVGLLYLEHAGRPNDYFLYQPGTRRVRRLPETVADDDVYGVDLEFLGFGVAQTVPTEIGGMDVETLDGRRVYRLRERALERNPRFEERVTWIDAETFVPVRTEHLRGDETELVAETTELRTVQDVPTPARMAFRRVSGDRAVNLEVLEVDYDAPIPDDYFSVMALVRSRR